MRKNNQGFSMVELIIAITIMAVLIGTVIYQAGIVGRGRMDSCVKSLVSNLEMSRMEAMSFREAQFKLAVHTKDIEGIRGVKKGENFVEESFSLANNNISVYVTLTKGTLTEEIKMQNGDYIVFSFDRSSGAFKPIHGQVGGAVIMESTYCEEIRLESSEYERIISFVPLTGKIAAE